MYPSTEMLISVQKYKLQYRNISPILSTQMTAAVQKKISISWHKNINFRTNIFIVVCDYILQYNKIHVFNSTTICISIQKYKFQYKNKIGEIGRYFTYDYYHVPKYMLIIVYLNKPCIFHYYKLSRLYSTKHKHLYTTPYITIQHHAPLHLTKYL